MTAMKHDSDKVRLELLSVPALTAIAEVLTFGAKKYADHNWRKGFDWSRLFGAAMRHLFAAMRGEDLDPESGLPHLAHLGCCVMFLLEHYLCKLGRDDRYRQPDSLVHFIPAVSGLKPEDLSNEGTITRLADGTEVEWGTGSSRLLDYVK